MTKTRNIARKFECVSISTETVSVSGDPHSPVDLKHLSHQTQGDIELEREILALFVVQCENCLKSLSSATAPASIAEIAHQMKGSAGSVGAGQVAECAKLLEANPAQNELMANLAAQINKVLEFIRTL